MLKSSGSILQVGGDQGCSLWLLPRGTFNWAWARIVGSRGFAVSNPWELEREDREGGW